MFSPEVFQVTLENYNQLLWPLQVLILGFFALALFRFRKNPFIAWWGLSASWLFLAFIFVGDHLGPLVLNDDWLKTGFVFQGLLSAVVGILIFQRPAASGCPTNTLLIFLSVVALLPFSSLSHPDFYSYLAIGWGPIQTALVTVGLTGLLSSLGLKLLVGTLPVIWIFFSGLYLLAL